MITCICPHCIKEIEFLSTQAGLAAPCPSCGRNVTVPGTPPARTSTTPPPRTSPTPPARSSGTHIHGQSKVKLKPILPPDDPEGKIRCRCPHCNRILRVPQGTAGQVSACPGCGGNFTVPADLAEPEEKEPEEKTFEVVEEAVADASTEAKIRCRCPHCNRILRVAQAVAGQVSTCPGCNGQFTVPREMAESATRPVAWEPPEEPRRKRRKRRRDYDDDYDDYPRRKRQRSESDRSDGARQLFIVLGSLSGIFLVFLLLGLIAPKVGGPLLILMGVVCLLGGNIWFLVVAFSDEVMHGVLCLLCGPYSLVYLCMNWAETHKPFLVVVLGYICIFVGGSIAGVKW